MREIEAEDWAKIDTMTFEEGKVYLLCFDRKLHHRKDVEIFLGRLNEIGIKVAGFYGDGIVPTVFALEGVK